MRILKALVLAAVAICALPLFAAVDTFLKIEGVQGAAQDSAHQGWFELTNWMWVSPKPNAVPKVACNVHEAKFAAVPNSPAELRLKHMCDAHERFPMLTVDIKGQRHVLQNVAFRTCEGNAISNAVLKNFTIYFDRCSTHGGIAPLSPVSP